ncbi:MAG TPA: TrkH family potassium uptake protein [Planctomycetota bacterium]|nr:TrkH family potassium uptake protein [Planctomycetota bacterium]
MNLRAIAWLVGRVVQLLAVFLIVPAGVALYYGEGDDALVFAATAVGSSLLGYALAFRNLGSTVTVEGRPDFYRREGLAAVGLSWLVVPLLGAVPFVATGAIPDPVDAFFESASGFTTTGSTILLAAEIDALSHAVAFWRSLAHWLGGIGIVLVFVVFFPTGGRSLFRSEVPGIAREAVQQRVRDSALGLARIYVALTGLEVLALALAGMTPFDAVIHAFGSLATGGFSNRGASVAFYASFTIEAIIIVFMFLAGLNFAVYEVGLRQGWRACLRFVRRSSEVRAYVWSTLLGALVIGGTLWFWGGSNGAAESELPDYSRLGTCLRDSTFAVVSVRTGTGFATADFDRWPELCRAGLMLLMVVGACAGSTGGGLKVVRFLIAVKVALRGVLAFSRPRALHPIRIDGEVLDEEVVGSVTGYFALWMLVFAAVTLALTGMGVGLVSAATATIATLNNIGPGLDQVGPWGSFADIPLVGKVLLSGTMILGRLEFYALVVLLVPRFWRS